MNGKVFNTMSGVNDLQFNVIHMRQILKIVNAIDNKLVN